MTPETILLRNIKRFSAAVPVAKVPRVNISDMGQRDFWLFRGLSGTCEFMSLSPLLKM
jgi:hypothetical protein